MQANKVYVMPKQLNNFLWGVHMLRHSSQAIHIHITTSGVIYTDLLSAYEEVVIEALKVLGPVVQCDWITQRRLCPCSQHTVVIRHDRLELQATKQTALCCYKQWQRPIKCTALQANSSRQLKSSRRWCC